MKKLWIMGAALLAILAGGAAYFYFVHSSPATPIAHAARIENQWSEVNKVTEKSVGGVLKSLKQSESISDLSASFVDLTKDAKAEHKADFSGALQVQVKVKNLLSQKDRITLSRHLLKVLFANRNVHEIFLTAVASDHQMIQLIAERDAFMKHNGQKTLSAGLQQLTILNEGV